MKNILRNTTSSHFCWNKILSMLYLYIRKHSNILLHHSFKLQIRLSGEVRNMAFSHWAVWTPHLRNFLVQFPSSSLTSISSKSWSGNSQVVVDLIELPFWKFWGISALSPCIGSRAVTLGLSIVLNTNTLKVNMKLGGSNALNILRWYLHQQN